MERITIRSVAKKIRIDWDNTSSEKQEKIRTGMRYMLLVFLEDRLFDKEQLLGVIATVSFEEISFDFKRRIGMKMTIPVTHQKYIMSQIEWEKSEKDKNRVYSS